MMRLGLIAATRTHRPLEPLPWLLKQCTTSCPPPPAHPPPEERVQRDGVLPPAPSVKDGFRWGLGTVSVTSGSPPVVVSLSQLMRGLPAADRSPPMAPTSYLLAWVLVGNDARQERHQMRFHPEVTLDRVRSIAHCPGR